MRGPRLLTAIAQILGSSWRAEEDWGGLLFTPPSVEITPWNVNTGNWHWDRNPFGLVGGTSSGLQIFMFLDEVQPGGGGTLIVEGSPELLLRYHETIPPDARNRKRSSIRKGFYKTHPWLIYLNYQLDEPEVRMEKLMHRVTLIDDVPVRVIELTGKPGDAIICHPIILHSGSQNRASMPRFMISKMIRTEGSIARLR